MMGRASRQYFEDLSLICDRRPGAWFRENVDGTVDVMRRANDLVVLATGPNRHEAVTLAARQIREYEAELVKIGTLHG